MDTSEFKFMLWDNTRKINEEMNTALNAWGNQYELSALQLRILMDIFKSGPESVGCLANNVAIAGTNISTMCKKLERLGYLARTRDRSDERIVQIELTGKGAEIMKELDHCFEKKILNAMGEDDNDCLRMIITAMEKLNQIFSCLDGLKIDKENEKR